MLTQNTRLVVRVSGVRSLVLLPSVQILPSQFQSLNWIPHWKLLNIKASYQPRPLLPSSKLLPCYSTIVAIPDRRVKRKPHKAESTQVEGKGKMDEI
mmetsp:Transcript_22349/g.35124  ORF Transcript_22349/g.35124 Transcript_22349/m.35124 type:complete len:97 (-) Transcript_22349:2678-2968(-)